jgi:hypothetical protein
MDESYVGGRRKGRHRGGAPTMCWMYPRSSGVPKEPCPLFLKECEWRFNNPHPQLQFKQLNQWAKRYMG